MINTVINLCPQPQLWVCRGLPFDLLEGIPYTNIQLLRKERKKVLNLQELIKIAESSL